MRAFGQTARTSASLPFSAGHHERRRLKAALAQRLEEKAESFRQEAARLRARGDFRGATTLQCAAVRLNAITIGDAGLSRTA
ncbi:MAG: hypothetical protein RIA10_10840 [Amphiplicatus sp.]